jgi:hypothetical protein
MVVQVGYSVTGRSRGRGGVVCGLHRACGDDEREFLG